MTKFVYQLRFKGRYEGVSGECLINSSTVFNTKENAEKRIDNFTKKIFAINSFLKPDPTQPYTISVEPLEIIED